MISTMRLAKKPTAREMRVPDLEHVAVVGAQSLRGGALPGELEVLGGNVLAVGPLGAVADGVGVGHGAVGIDNALHQLLGGVGDDDQVALVILGPLGQAGEQMGDHGCAVHGRVQSGVQRVGLGGEADRDAGGLRGRVCSAVGGIGGLGAGREGQHHGEHQQEC